MDRGGVELRKRSIRVGFPLNGRWERETLNIPPTPANERYAAQLVDRVKRAIRLGTFKWEDFFPESKRVKEAAGGAKTLRQAADLYLRSVGRKSDATKDQYKNAANMWCELFGGDTPLEALTHDVLAAKIGETPWASPKLVNNALIVLRGTFALQFKGPKAALNPMIGIENSKSVKKMPDPLSAEERDRILASMAEKYDPRVTAYFTVAFYTGMRPEELIALRWGDVDFRHGIIHVQRVRTFKGSERDGSKTHTERDVDMVDAVVAALKVMKPFTFMKDQDCDIFENPNTEAPWHDERSQRDHYWHPTLKRLGIRRRRPYSTRHTYATVALMAGVNPSYIARQLGHTNSRMLFEKYARWIDGADKGNEKGKLQAALASKVSPEFPRMVEGAESSEENSGRRDWTRTKKGTQ
jgi:integrase